MDLAVVVLALAGVCILIGAAASAMGLLGFLLYRRIKKTGKASTAQQ
jgi:multisubunit Na+/H+ antiporter MnhG subunit